MSDPTDVRMIADEIRAHADIASRSGQTAELLALARDVEGLPALIAAQIRTRILAAVHDEVNGIPFDSHYDIAIVAAWIAEWFDR